MVSNAAALVQKNGHSCKTLIFALYESFYKRGVIILLTCLERIQRHSERHTRHWESLLYIRVGYRYQTDSSSTNKSRWKSVLCEVIQVCRCMPSYNAVELIIRGIWATGNIITYPCRNSRRNALQANRRHCIALLEVSGNLWPLPILSHNSKTSPFSIVFVKGYNYTLNPFKCRCGRSERAYKPFWKQYYKKPLHLVFWASAAA